MGDALNFPPQRRYDLLALGDPVLDLLFAVDTAPQADQKVLGRRLAPHAGGTVANVACAASLLGRATLAYGRLAGDAEGDFLRREYQRYGVCTSGLRVVAAASSPTALILIEACGEKALVYSPMPGPVLEPDTLATALADSRLLYAMPYDLAEFRQIHALARAAGVPLAIDIEAAMVPERDHLQQLLSLCDLAFMSDSTYHALFGCAPELSAMSSLLHYATHGARMLVITCGVRGALAVTPQQALTQPAFAARVVDSTGAGDSFNGAFLSALLEQMPLQSALRFACAAGSLAVGATGARSALPTRAQIEVLLRRA